MHITFTFPTGFLCLIFSGLWRQLCEDYIYNQAIMSVFVALVIQRASLIGRIVICGLSGFTTFFHVIS